MDNLECFWDSIREFLNVMVGFRVGTVPDPIATAVEAIFKGERVEITNPIGYTECVIHAMSRVVPEELPNDQGSLFHSARWHFERFLGRYGDRSADGDLQWIGPPGADDPDALALKELVTGRIPSPARSLAPTAPPEPPAASGGEAKAETTIEPGESRPTPPSEKAIQCYRLLILRGDETTQAATAMRVYGDPRKQSQVSRDIRRVKAWISARNVLPDLDGPKPKVHAVDPAKLDKGPGQAGRGRPR